MGIVSMLDDIVSGLGNVSLQEKRMKLHEAALPSRHPASALPAAANR